MLTEPPRGTATPSPARPASPAAGDRGGRPRAPAHDALYRWVPALCDVAAALVALDVLAGKVLGLYDHDVLVMRRLTLDELPSLAQLALVFTFGCWVAELPLTGGRMHHS